MNQLDKKMSHWSSKEKTLPLPAAYYRIPDIDSYQELEGMFFLLHLVN